MSGTSPPKRGGGIFMNLEEKKYEKSIRNIR